MDRAPFERTIALIGERKFLRLRQAEVLVVGLGGVGGAAVEVLARSGIGKLTLVDGDVFEPSNLNRQLLCTRSDIGKSKAHAAKNRVFEIDPNVEVTAVNEFVNESNLAGLVSDRLTYCIDAIDDVKNKVALISECRRKNIPIISAMGAGNRIDCGFAVTDIFKTKDDPFAKKLRHELRKAGIQYLDVVCGTTPPAVVSGTPLSIAAPPMVMGAMLANYAITEILAK